ncbi:MAG: dimethyl sulfoxide reductase anchor subunit [Rubrivivax sp.]|jgi:DMSO reductase anchor subunit|nr:dimethyl sulfoxide reductase anchor subunit [Rubrivivax sp.]
MHPAWSILCFTTLVGVAQGLATLLAVATLMRVSMTPGFVAGALALSLFLLLAGLVSSFLHLGHPRRAWRAVLMWRTSWMSREVIVLPAFIGLVGLWWLALVVGHPIGQSPWLPALVIAGALALWVCTAMIYACLRFIEEWAHPLTVVNFVLIGLSSGMVLACALAAAAGQDALLRRFGLATLLLVLAAWAMRVVSLRRHARIRHRSTLQSATGLRAGKLAQTSMGMSAGSFNTREFFHGAVPVTVQRVRLGFQVMGFLLPALCLVAGLAGLGGQGGGSALPWLLASACQLPGLLAERWLFFAEAKHPQNLYYQTVS